MVVTRELDTEFVNLQRQGELALFASCRGQEAAQIGTTAACAKTDWLFPQYRELGAFLLRGLTPAQIGRGVAGQVARGAGVHEKCVAPISIPIGTQGLHAAGAAMAAQRLGEDSVTVAFLGDGGTSSEGDCHEALNFAAVFKAPCVFVVREQPLGDLGSAQQSSPPAPTFAHKAIGYGMPGVRVDGNDVLAVYQAGRRPPRAPGTAGPDADRGGHLPDGAAHHLRRPDPLPVRRGTRVLGGTRSDSALPHLPAGARRMDRASWRTE